MMGLQGCIYTMPSEDDFSEVPHTNNPAVTEEQPNRLLLPKG